jgi:hypothetical protein
VPVNAVHAASAMQPSSAGNIHASAGADTPASHRTPTGATTASAGSSHDTTRAGPRRPRTSSRAATPTHRTYARSGSAIHATTGHGAAGETASAAIAITSARHPATRPLAPGSCRCSTSYASTHAPSSTAQGNVADPTMPPEPSAGMPTNASSAVPTANMTTPAARARASVTRPEGIGRNGRSAASTRASKASFRTIPAQ